MECGVIMPIIEPVIRPPAEALSFFLQITTGCSANQCGFCGAYLHKSFRIKDRKEIKQDIDHGAQHCPETRRVFLMDGDALAMKNDRLIPILKDLQHAFPKLSRITSYANGYNITGRSDSQLGDLYDHRLRLVYMGLESGSQEILDFCTKRSGVDEMIDAVIKATRAGIKTSVIVLLGLGGKERSGIHIKETIHALNRMQPRYLSFLSVMLIPGTPLHRLQQDGSFTELSPRELLLEARGIIAGLILNKTIFRSDHASNYLSLEGRFPADKEHLIKSLDAALEGRIRLKPEWMRGL